MNYNLRITIWNVNGLQNKVNELEVFLRNENIDICLVSETHVTNQPFCRLQGTI